MEYKSSVIDRQTHLAHMTVYKSLNNHRAWAAVNRWAIFLVAIPSISGVSMGKSAATDDNERNMVNLHTYQAQCNVDICHIDLELIAVACHTYHAMQIQSAEFELKEVNRRRSLP